jgi:citrate lyase subunit beta/citryl-CoA lyase
VNPAVTVMAAVNNTNCAGTTPDGSISIQINGAAPASGFVIEWFEGNTTVDTVGTTVGSVDPLNRLIAQELAADDLAAAAHAAPDVILLPKISMVDQLDLVGQRLLDMKYDLKTRIWAMIETPIAIFNIQALAAEARDSETRLAGFVMGTNDLAKETRARLMPGREPMLPWLATCVLAARAYGIDILDGVYNDLSDPEGFERECAQARDMGFDGKTLIHPNQIGPCNTAFSPSSEDIAQARKMIAAFDLPENRDKGVVQVDGRMVERMHAEMARRTVAIAEAIATQG